MTARSAPTGGANSFGFRIRFNNNMKFTVSPTGKIRHGGRLGLLAACISLICVESVALEPPPAELQALVERQARDKQVCAVAYATVHAGKLSGVGSASGCDGATAPAEDAVFQAASLSKPVFAYAVLKLAQEGLLALDTPLLEYLPQGYWHVQNPFAFGRPPISERVAAPELQAVTARMVLSHTSGLPNWSDGPLAFDFAPGSGWQYSGEGFMLLQRAVESITNQKLDDFMRHRLFAPLGMSQTAFQWEPRFAGSFVPGQPWHVNIPEALAPFSLHTTAKDYAKFLAALLSDTQAVQLIARDPVSVVPRLNVGWGLGWGIESGEQAVFIWQWGNNPGYRAFVMASTRSGDAVVMLTNSEDGLALAEPVVSAVLPGRHGVFRSYLVREGFSYVACKTLDWCL